MTTWCLPADYMRTSQSKDWPGSCTSSVTHLFSEDRVQLVVILWDLVRTICKQWND